MSDLARPAGLEPATPRLGIWCSIRLSYGRSCSISTPLSESYQVANNWRYGARQALSARPSHDSEVNIPDFLAANIDRIAIAAVAALVVLWLGRRTWRRWRAAAAAGRAPWRRFLGAAVALLLMAIISMLGLSVLANGVEITVFLIGWFSIIATELMGGTVTP